jgi:hypothetical protein
MGKEKDSSCPRGEQATRDKEEMEGKGRKGGVTGDCLTARDSVEEGADRIRNQGQSQSQIQLNQERNRQLPFFLL